MFDKKGPGVEQVDLVHHDDHDAVPALQAARMRVLHEERVAEHVAAMVVAEKDRAFTTWTDLMREKNAYTRIWFLEL